MFKAKHINENRWFVYQEEGPDAERGQLEVLVGSLGIYRTDTGIVLQDIRAEKGIFVPDETLPLIEDVITRMKIL